jgi:magnesium transporter
VEVLTALEEERITASRGADSFFWLTLEAPSRDQIERLGALLGLHELALEDTREMSQPPKVDRYRGHVLVVWWSAIERDGGFEPVEVHLYVSGGWVVVVHRQPVPALAPLRRELEDGEHAESDVVYRILDALTDALQPIVARIEERVDGLEELVLLKPRREHVADIYRLKQDVRDILRRISSQREQFPIISSAIEALPGLTLGSPQAQSDLRDHLRQADEDLSRQNDDLISLTATYFNAATVRLSTIGTRLSVIATLFLVWTLVTSFFGQNFGWMVDNINTQRDFLIFGVGGFLASTAGASLFLWWRRKDLS